MYISQYKQEQFLMKWSALYDNLWPSVSYDPGTMCTWSGWSANCQHSQLSRPDDQMLELRLDLVTAMCVQMHWCPWSRSVCILTFRWHREYVYVYVDPMSHMWDTLKNVKYRITQFESAPPTSWSFRLLLQRYDHYVPPSISYFIIFQHCKSLWMQQEKQTSSMTLTSAGVVIHQLWNSQFHVQMTRC